MHDHREEEDHSEDRGGPVILWHAPLVESTLSYFYLSSFTATLWEKTEKGRVQSPESGENNNFCSQWLWVSGPDYQNRKITVIKNKLHLCWKGDPQWLSRNFIGITDLLCLLKCFPNLISTLLNYSMQVIYFPAGNHFILAQSKGSQPWLHISITWGAFKSLMTWGHPRPIDQNLWGGSPGDSKVLLKLRNTERFLTSVFIILGGLPPPPTEIWFGRFGIFPRSASLTCISTAPDACGSGAHFENYCSSDRNS